METRLLPPEQQPRERKNETPRVRRVSASCNLPQGTMVAAVLIMYCIGTAVSVLTALYGIVDSFGGLMYAQDHHYIMDLDQQTQTPLSSGSHRRGSPPTKNTGS